MYVLDTVKVYNYITVHDTIKVNQYIPVYDTVHLSVEDTLVVYSGTSLVNGNTIISRVSVYPNPTSNMLNIDIENNNIIANYTVQICDVNGKVVYSSFLNSEHLEIDLSSYAKGVYIIRLINQYQQILSIKNLIIK